VTFIEPDTIACQFLADCRNLGKQLAKVYEEAAEADPEGAKEVDERFCSDNSLAELPSASPMS
jgi:hypothetical protein